MWGCGWGNEEWGKSSFSLCLFKSIYYISISILGHKAHCDYFPTAYPPQEIAISTCALVNISPSEIFFYDWLSAAALMVWRENATSYIKECSLFTAGSSLLFVINSEICVRQVLLNTGNMSERTINAAGEACEMTQPASLFPIRTHILVSEGTRALSSPDNIFLLSLVKGRP